MKKILSFLFFSLIFALIAVISVSAKATATSPVVSCGLDVIAAQNDMALAGLNGNDLPFSAECFARALNLSNVRYITISELPPSAEGCLYIGSTPVAKGQTLSASNISLMTFESADERGGNSSFRFTVNGSGYSIKCGIFMLESINYSPTVAMAPAVSLNLRTYSGVKLSGVLSAYDPEGDQMVFEIVRYPSYGTLTLSDASLGVYQYVPDPDYTGTDSFKYAARDQYGNYSASATVNLSIKSAGAQTVFSDLSGDQTYAAAVNMTGNGVMSGMQVGGGYYFYPDKQVSRADFLVMAMKAAGIQCSGSISDTGFEDDADIPSAMKGYVATALSKNYVSGVKVDGKLYFRPNEVISRAEAAVILSNIIGYAEVTVSPAFSDASAIPSWAKNAVTSLYSLGILESSDGSIHPSDPLTRANTAILLDKTMQVMGR